jgi:hypothetical protein
VTFNHGVQGSNPCGLTNKFSELERNGHKSEESAWRTRMEGTEPAAGR